MNQLQLGDMVRDVVTGFTGELVEIRTRKNDQTRVVICGQKDGLEQDLVFPASQIEAAPATSTAPDTSPA